MNISKKLIDTLKKTKIGFHEINSVEVDNFGTGHKLIISYTKNYTTNTSYPDLGFSSGPRVIYGMNKFTHIQHTDIYDTVSDISLLKQFGIKIQCKKTLTYNSLL